MKIPFLDLKYLHQPLANELQAAAKRVIASGWYINGSELENFEHHFARFCSAEECIGVANGLQALELSLQALEIGPGDEVIVPSNTFIATWLAVTAVGASIVPVEPNPNTHNITADTVAPAITPKTKAIIPVHLYGQPVELDPILELAKTHKIYVIDDAAQAHGATYKGKLIGSLCDVTAFSFYPGKNLGALGDGGAITCQDPALAKKIRMLRNYGSKKKYHHELAGTNSRLDEIQAAFLNIKLQHLAEWTAHRQKIAALYTEKLSQQLAVPVVSKDVTSAWHLYVLNTNQRDELQTFLSENGIQSMIHYPIPPHRQGAYQHTDLANLALPIAETLADSVLSIPMGEHVGIDQANYVVSMVSQFCSTVGSVPCRT